MNYISCKVITECTVKWIRSSISWKNIFKLTTKHLKAYTIYKSMSPQLEGEIKPTSKKPVLKQTESFHSLLL